MIMISSAGVAFLIIYKDICHCRMLSESISLVEFISSRAIFSGAPISDILQSISFCDKQMQKQLSDNFMSDIQNGNTVPDAWENAVLSVTGKQLHVYECDVIIHYGKDMCSSNADDIKRINSKAVSALTDFYNTAVENKNRKSKSTAAIAISVGAMIVLMLA